MKNGHQPGRYGAALAALRVVGVTVLVALLAFCIALFFGIVGIVLTKMIRGTPGPDMSVAYRDIAFPVAIVVLIVVFVVALVSEVRHYRRQRKRARMFMGPGKAA